MRRVVIYNNKSNYCPKKKQIFSLKKQISQKLLRWKEVATTICHNRKHFRAEGLCIDC
jgi:hypothetical protein